MEYNFSNAICLMPYQKKEQKNTFVELNGKMYPVYSGDTYKNSAVYVSENMSAKMENIVSISTSCLENNLCEKRRKIPGSICEHCFSVGTQNQYSALSEHIKLNGEIMSEIEIPVELLPHFSKCDLIRIESFGDLINTTHAVNDLNIILENPGNAFGWWTKNPIFLYAAFKKLGFKPDNVTTVFSGLMIDDTENSYRIFKFWNDYSMKTLGFAMFDKCFVVESKETSRTNCGKAQCYKCRACYDKSEVTSDLRIEVLK